MKSLILLITILAFLQSTITSLDLVLLVILIRSFLIDDSLNLSLAFSFGLLIGLLTAQNMGVVSILNLTAVALIYLAKRTRLTQNWLTVLPLVALVSLGHRLLLGLITHHSTDWQSYLYQVGLIIPLYLLIKLWEERFIPPTGIKLKI